MKKDEKSTCLSHSLSCHIGPLGERALPSEAARAPLRKTVTSATLSLRVGGLLQRAQGSDA